MYRKKQKKSAIFLVLIILVILFFVFFDNKNTPNIVQKEKKIFENYFDKIFVDHPFTVPAELKTNVNFWKNIFANTSIYSIVFFTPNENIKIKQIDTKIDFSLSNKGLVNITLVSDDEEITKFTPQDLLDTTNPENLLNLSVVQTKIDEIYDELNAKLKENGTIQIDDNIGYARGRKEKFEKAWIASGKFLNQIKKIFKEEGVPEEVANLAFTESLFDYYALSESNAVGIFQMIPETARNYGLIVNKFVDERRDPLLEARAAAKYLKTIYAEFDNWLFAINAYHSGENNLKKALAWAEKNYPNKSEDFQGHLRDYQYLKVVEEFRDDREFNNNQTLRYGRESSRYTTLFLAFLEAEKEYFSKNLSQDSEITLSQHKVSYNKDYLQEEMVQVNSGDTLSKISFDHGITLEELKSWNNLTDSFIRTGQKLKIFKENPPLKFGEIINLLELSEEQKQFIFEHNYAYRNKNSTFEEFSLKKIYNKTTINFPSELEEDILTLFSSY